MGKVVVVSAEVTGGSRGGVAARWWWYGKGDEVEWSRLWDGDGGSKVVRSGGCWPDMMADVRLLVDKGGDDGGNYGVEVGGAVVMVMVAAMVVAVA
ncbi:hypothetical protein Tco_1484235 [Tanacetum coccineum]